MKWKENDLLSELEKEIRIKRREARREYKCQFGAANQCRELHNRYGTAAIVLAGIAGSGFILEAIYSFPVLKFLPSLLTLLAALCSALVTFKRYLDTAQQHYQTGNNWELLRDEYTQVLFSIYNLRDDQEVETILDQSKQLSIRRAKLREEGIAYPEWLFKLHENIKDKTEIEE